MVKEWHTVSVRLNSEEKQALDILCERKEIKKNHLLRALVEQEIEPLLKPGTVPVGEGLPQIGEHKFKYNAEKNTFTWQLDQGTQGTAILAENVDPSFLKTMKEAITSALTEEEKANEKITGKKSRIPRSIDKLKVRR